MQETITPLTDEDRVYLDRLRTWLRGHFKEGEQAKYDQIEGKLFVVDAIIKNNWFDRKQPSQLQALGVGIGDALAQRLGMSWVVVEDQFGRSPTLHLHGTSLKLNAFTMIQKRVANGEDDIDAFSLFGAFCHSVEQIRAPKRSMLGRLFGPRLK